MGHPGSNKVREFDCQDIQATIMRRATEKNFKSILFTLLKNKEMKAIATEVFSTKIFSESQKFAKMRNSLNTCDPVLVSEFRNSRFAKELKEQTPFLHCALRGAVKDEMDFNQIALAGAACISTRTKSFAFLLRNTIILQHGGCKAQDISRLNRLGICSSHDTSIRAQRRMGACFDEDVKEWKEEIEKAKTSILLLEEVRDKQIPFYEEHDMEVDISIEFTRETLSTYKHFTESAFSNCQKLLAQISDGINSDFNQDVLTHCLHHLKSLELPTYRSCSFSYSKYFKILFICISTPRFFSEKTSSFK